MEDWEKAWVSYIGDVPCVPKNDERANLTTTYTDDTLYPMHKELMSTPVSKIPAEYLLKQAEQAGGIPAQLRNYIMLNFSRLLEREAFEIDHPNPLPQKEVPIKQIKPPAEFICQKRTYANQQLAKVALNRIRGIDDGRVKPVRTYECPDCNGWHLSSIEQTEFKRMEKFRKDHPLNGASPSEINQGTKSQ